MKIVSYHTVTEVYGINAGLANSPVDLLDKMFEASGVFGVETVGLSGDVHELDEGVSVSLYAKTGCITIHTNVETKFATIDVIIRGVLNKAESISKALVSHINTDNRAVGVPAVVSKMATKENSV